MTNLEKYKLGALNLQKIISGSRGDYYQLNIYCDGEYKEIEFSNKDEYIEWLLAEYKPIFKFKLTQFEYDLLKQIKPKNYAKRPKFCDYGYLVNMQKLGYFKGVDIQLSVDDVLEHCEVKEND